MNKIYSLVRKTYFSIPNNIRKHLPFFYYDIIKGKIPNNTKTILDLCCGEGQYIHLLKNPRDIKVTGIEGHEPTYLRAKEKGMFDRLLHEDITKHMFEHEYDVTLLLYSLEHLTRKDGLDMLDIIESITKRMIIITVPRHTIEQDAFAERNNEKINPFQKHKSGEWCEELIKRGYKLYGLDGWKRTRDENYKIKGGKVFYWFCLMLTILSQPIVYHYWKEAMLVMAVKVIK